MIEEIHDDEFLWENEYDLIEEQEIDSKDHPISDSLCHQKV